MRREQPNQKLDRLHEAAETISANLVDLEVDSSRQLLEASALEGESGARWSAASDALTELWRRHGLLEDLLKQADDLRGSRRAGEIPSLLDGQSIELATSDVPLAERNLLGNARVAERCSPDELLVQMSSTFDEVKSVVSAIGSAWDALIPKLDRARHLCATATQLSREVGEQGNHDLETASQTLGALSARVTTDPLSVPTGEVDALIHALESVKDNLDQSASLMHGFEARILESRELFERLRRTASEARAAREELLVKIAAPAVPSAPREGDELETQLAGIVELAQQGGWGEVHRALADWTARAGAVLDDARCARDASRAPIRSRNQLRALLDAYQVKAKRLGVVEDPVLADIFARARESLYSAPTDLAVAAQLVRSYQQALRGSSSAAEATR